MMVSILSTLFWIWIVGMFIQTLVVSYVGFIKHKDNITDKTTFKLFLFSVIFWPVTVYALMTDA